MSNYSVMHETVIRDIVDIANDVHKSEYIKGFRANDSFKSISNASDALTLVFPVITSRSISVENATMVSKAIERKAVTMLQMLFSAININNSANGLDYLKKFHTNLKMDDAMSVDSFIDLMDSLSDGLDESANSMKYKREIDAIKEDLKFHTNYIIPESFNPVSLNDYKLVYSNYSGKTTLVQEAIDDEEESELYMDSDFRDIKNHVDILQKQLIDTDVKKANELIPTVMIVNFISNVDGCPIDTRLIIGVKAKIYPVDSNDIMERIYSKNSDRNGFLKFIRATTREISFVKDFLFAIDKAKIDALSTSKRGSSNKIWKILERRTLKSRVRRALGQPNDASAISTLVISQEEVEYMKKQYNVNVENPRVMRGIMESYNLMGAVIVDELNEVCDFLFDTGNDVYEKVAFRSLERESADNDFRKMITLMTKMR